MAIDLITGHQGQLHISAEQIATLNNASLNGYGDHKVLRMVNGTVFYTGLVISIATGYWRVNGFDMEIYESENVYIDPSTIGTSRIDKVFVEILQDIPSGVQRSELVVVMGEESANTPIAPDAPTDPELNTDLMLQCEEVCVVIVTEGAMTLSDSTIAFNVVTPAELATVDTKVDNALGMIQKSSDAYSDSSPYKVGDYVIHNNKVYICTTACVAGSWATNSGYFTETSLTTAVTDLNSALTWKYHDTLTGSTPIALPLEYKELYLDISMNEAGASDTPKYHFTLNVLKDIIPSSGNIEYIDGWAQVVSNKWVAYSYSLLINRNSLTLSTCKKSDTDYLSTSKIHIYYR